MTGPYVIRALSLYSDSFSKKSGLVFIIYLILTKLSFGSSIKETFLNSDLISYEVFPKPSYVPYHILQKRELTPATETTSDTEVTKVVSLAQNATTPLPSDSSGNTTVMEEVTSPSSNTVYEEDIREELEENLDDLDIINTSNNTQTTHKFDHHKYYRSYSKSGVEEVIQYWVDLDSSSNDGVVLDQSLSSAHRRALTVSLTFDFPFYGHTLRNVTIATGGFLFTGSFLHKWLAATQYIAPLMANFDTSVSPLAKVKYMDNGTSLTVQWEKVVLQDNPEAGEFTFQVTIHKSGHIIFAYKDIPVIVTLIGDVAHPVKVGLSDAYIVEKTIFYVRKKTIYEYHKIDIKKGMQIGNWTAIVFEPLQMCVSFHSCESCLTSDTNFKCEWCPQVERCSDGVDRHRQNWIKGGCDSSAISNVSHCALLPPPSTPSLDLDGASTGAVVKQQHEMETSSHSNLWVGFFLTIVVVAFVGGCVAYAYLHPHTASGQLLIKYRPSAWSWRRGGARYTAATMHSIHM